MALSGDFTQPSVFLFKVVLPQLCDGNEALYDRVHVAIETHVSEADHSLAIFRVLLVLFFHWGRIVNLPGFRLVLLVVPNVD